MADIFLKRDSNLAATYVPNSFIDDYMTQADGEFVKIYLYLLRCMSNSDTPFSISGTADRFDETERDVKRALRYWEKMRLLRLEFDSQEELTGICLLDVTDASEKEPTSAVEIKLPPRREYTNEQMRHFSKDEVITELLFVAEQYIGHPLSNNDVQTILYWRDQLKFSQDMIEYLIEQSVSKGHRSIRYMDKIAISWAGDGICTIDDARHAFQSHSSTVYAVMKSFGINGRSLVDYEKKYIEKWSKEYGFSDEMISYACERTIRNIHQISFEYADSILCNWKSQNIYMPKDVAVSDANHQAAQAQKNAAVSTARIPKTRTAPNRFLNFEQRSYDYDSIEKNLLGKL